MKKWQQRLLRAAEELVRLRGSIRIGIIGVGHPLYGDDAIGTEVVRYLAKSALAQRDDLLLLTVGPAPENFSSVIRRFAPDLVVFLDAACMGMKLGSVAWFEREDLPGWTISTGSYPLSILADYLSVATGCKVVYLGIQVGTVAHGEISSHMLGCAEEIGEELITVLRCLDLPIAVSAYQNRAKRADHGHENTFEIQPA